MESPEPTGFLDVATLLESSHPRPRVQRIWWVAGVLLLIILSGSLVGSSGQGHQAVQGLAAVAILLLMLVLSGSMVYAVRRLRAEQQSVEQIGELIQLRRWPEAALALQNYLSQPARTMQLRVQALVFLASVLLRLHRFDDAIAVQQRLLEEDVVDDAGAAALRIGRAMAMLREDHLFDADRAINELRRGPASASAALALVEIYRDVKTGHPAEAIELFEQKLPELRDQLGHRVGDAYALAARAYDLLGREVQARDAFAKATLLAPMGELFRRYPEVEKLSGRYQPSAAPPEAA